MCHTANVISGEADASQTMDHDRTPGIDETSHSFHALRPILRCIVNYISNVTESRFFPVFIMSAKFLRNFITLFLVFWSTLALADRTVTDQLGRKVDIPDQVNHVVVLQHQTLDILVQLHAADKIVGVMKSWKKQLGPDFARFYPALSSMPTPGDLESVNIEGVLALKPDVVFITNYAPASMIEQLESSHIPAVAISLRRDKGEQAAALNPSLDNEDEAYTQGLKDGIQLIGDIVGKKKEADKLVAAFEGPRRSLTEKIAAINPEHRKRIYMANPELTTYGSGKYTGLMMEHAGAMNVAAKDIKGFKKVSMEDVLKWNPEVIFVQDRYPQVVEEIKTQPQWKDIDAVKNGQVFLMPEYAKAWGYPMPEAIALGETWMAKKLYPDQFADTDMQALADEYYTTFYGMKYTRPN